METDEWVGSRSWRMRVWLWRHSTIKGSGVCRRYGRAGGMVSVVSHGQGHAGTRGASACRRVWVCPQCAGAVARERAKAVRLACEIIGDPVMVTLTAPHVEGEALADVWDRLDVAWRRVRNDRNGWRGEFVRVTEVTTGIGGGWHPHRHVIVSASDAPWLLNAWLNACPGSEYKAQDVSDDADEFAARYLALEVTGANWKCRSHWSLLRRAAGVPEYSVERRRWEVPSDAVQARAATLWAEFEEASRGRKWFTWSKKLRAAVREAGLGTDDNDSVEDVGVTLVQDDSEAWNALAARGAGAALVYAMGRAEAWDLTKLAEAFKMEVAPWIKDATRAERLNEERTLW